MHRTIAGSSSSRAATRPPAPAVHPLGANARVLLCSVFGPYARDDEYVSRAVKPMELYHNQVTRVQGVFSLRMFHRSWGLMLIRANLGAPTTLLDFPTLERFVEELRAVRYDIVGISAILPNIAKVARMCAFVREHQPRATIVVGGHAANHPRPLIGTGLLVAMQREARRLRRGVVYEPPGFYESNRPHASAAAIPQLPTKTNELHVTHAVNPSRGDSM